SVPVASVSPAADENGYHLTDPVTVDLSATDAGPSGVASITYQVDGHEAVTVKGDAASVTVSGDGAHVVSYFATDTAGNVSQRGSQPVVIDTTAPGVTVRQAAGQDPTNADTVQFTATFTEPVTGFTAADMTVSAAAAGASVEVTGSGVEYLISVTGLTQDGAITVSVGADAAFDAAGHGNTASTDATVTRDTTAPVVEILSLTAADGAVTASGRAGAGAGDGSTVMLMICPGTGELGASEPSFPCTPSTVLTASVDGTTAEWSVTSDALAPGTYYVRAEQQDTAGNTGVSGVLSAAIPQP
ncbi:MAG: hypothetical protein JWQ67_928, partial [Marmoricola sp.]|nr:hypothetical protein [Marmoricola sp.]